VQKDTGAKLEALLAPLAAGHGLELWAVEVAGSSGRPLVRVLLDRDGGILLDDIAGANAWIGDALDESEDLRGPYVLEVSSPGIERPLRTPAQYARFLGQTVQAKTVAPQDGRKTFVGTLSSADDDGFTLDIDGAETRFGYENIAKCHLKVDFDFSDEGS
jgi:ribosome maturation factor RimP